MFDRALSPMPFIHLASMPLCSSTVTADTGAAPVGRLDFWKVTVSCCPTPTASYSGRPVLSGMDAVGTVIIGGAAPAVALSSNRMNPVSSVLVMSTAAASAAIALSTCMTELGWLLCETYGRQHGRQKRSAR